MKLFKFLILSPSIFWSGFCILIFTDPIWAKGYQVIMRRHKDIVAFKTEINSAAVAFHARNLEVAEVSEEVWSSMAPTTFNNSFVMAMESNEKGIDSEAFASLEEWHSEENLAVKSGEIKFGIRSLTINITQICNLHCTYCAAGGDGTYGDATAKISVEKTLPQIKFFMEKLKEGEHFHFTFLGGEPLLYPQGIQLIAQYANDLATKQKITVSFNVITNATLINDTILDVLKKIRSGITISIDGAPEDHDKARPQKNGHGSSESVLSGLIKIIQNKSDLGHIRLHSVLSRQNLEVLKCYKFLSELGADSYEFTFDVTESDPEANAKFVSEMSQVAALAYARGGETELRKIVQFDNHFNSLDSQRRTENFCGSGKQLLSIDSNNKIYACPLDVGHKEELKGTGIDLDTNSLKSLQDSFVTKNNCNNCWARFICGGGCLFVHKTLTGDKTKKHISFCERTRYLISLSLLYYEHSRR